MAVGSAAGNRCRTRLLLPAAAGSAATQRMSDWQTPVPALSLSYAYAEWSDRAGAGKVEGKPKIRPKRSSDLTVLPLDTSPPLYMVSEIDTSVIGELYGPNSTLATLGVHIFKLIRDSADRSTRRGKGFNVDQTYARTMDLLLRFLLQVQTEKPDFTTKDNLQVIGTTAAWICCKIEDPDNTILRSFNDQDFHTSVYTEMERFILFILGWKVTSPTSYDHLIEQIKDAPASELTCEEVNVAILFLQITQYSRCGRGAQLDFLAGGALYLSMLTLRFNRRLSFGDKEEDLDAMHKAAMNFTTKQCGLPECVILLHAKMHYTAMGDYLHQHTVTVPVLGALTGGRSGVDDVMFIHHEHSVGKSIFGSIMLIPSERERAKKNREHIISRRPDVKKLKKLFHLLSTKKLEKLFHLPSTKQGITEDIINPLTSRPTKRDRAWDEEE